MSIWLGVEHQPDEQLMGFNRNHETLLILGGIKQYKSMAILRDFPLYTLKCQCISFPRHLNTSWFGVLGMFLGSSHTSQNQVYGSLGIGL